MVVKVGQGLSELGISIRTLIWNHKTSLADTNHAHQLFGRYYQQKMATNSLPNPESYRHDSGDNPRRVWGQVSSDLFTESYRFRIRRSVTLKIETMPITLGTSAGNSSRVRNAIKTQGHPRYSRDIYNDDIVSEMQKSRMVIIMEDVSGLFRVSLWCATTPYFYYLGFEGFWQLPAIMVLGR